jgi:hypothetical protein
MSDLPVYIMLGLMGLTLLFALLAIATRLSAMTGGNPRTAYWSNILAGITFLLLSTSGLICIPYLEENKILVPVLSIGFGALGMYLLSTGIKTRREALRFRRP